MFKVSIGDGSNSRIDDAELIRKHGAAIVHTTVIQNGVAVVQSVSLAELVESYRKTTHYRKVSVTV